jgi:hypothetical protein
VCRAFDLPATGAHTPSAGRLRELGYVLASSFNKNAASCARSESARRVDGTQPARSMLLRRFLQTTPL